MLGKSITIAKIIKISNEKTHSRGSSLFQLSSIHFYNIVSLTLLKKKSYSFYTCGTLCMLYCLAEN